MVDIRPISKEWIEFLNLKKTELNFSYNVSKRATTKPYHRQPLSFTGIKLGSVTEKGERDQNGRSGEKQVHCPLRYWTPFLTLSSTVTISPLAKRIINIPGLIM